MLLLRASGSMRSAASNCVRRACSATAPDLYPRLGVMSLSGDENGLMFQSVDLDKWTALWTLTSGGIVLVPVVSFRTLKEIDRAPVRLWRDFVHAVRRGRGHIFPHAVPADAHDAGSR